VLVQGRHGVEWPSSASISLSNRLSAEKASGRTPDGRDMTERAWRLEVAVAYKSAPPHPAASRATAPQAHPAPGHHGHRHTRATVHTAPAGTPAGVVGQPGAGQHGAGLGLPEIGPLLTALLPGLPAPAQQALLWLIITAGPLLASLTVLRRR